jgi:DNA-binding Xre family transcriptional regulator
MRVTLKAMRVNREKTQHEVADALGVKVDRIKYLESKEGSAKISYSDLMAFCTLYECTADDIFLPINFAKRKV